MKRIPRLPIQPPAQRRLGLILGALRSHLQQVDGVLVGVAETDGARQVPDADGAVGAAGSEVLRVWGESHAVYGAAMVLFGES